MTAISPDDIPTSITKLIYSYRPDGHREDSFLPNLSQNQTAELLAHLWPAIEQHIREQVAEDIVRESKSQLNEIDELDRKPSDWERHQQWCDAAQVARDAEPKPGEAE